MSGSYEAVNIVIQFLTIVGKSGKPNGLSPDMSCSKLRSFNNLSEEGHREDGFLAFVYSYKQNGRFSRKQSCSMKKAKLRHPPLSDISAAETGLCPLDLPAVHSVTCRQYQVPVWFSDHFSENQYHYTIPSYPSQDIV